jgi:hypothetical protein
MNELELERAQAALMEWFRSQNIHPVYAVLVMTSLSYTLVKLLTGEEQKELWPKPPR